MFKPEIKNPFALIKLPRNSQIYFLGKEDKGSNQYTFTSFDIKKNYSFNFSELKKLEEVDVNFISRLTLEFNKKTETIEENEYNKLLNRTISFLEERKANKIVISREKWIEKENINILKSFKFLCEKQDNSFCHLSYWNSKEVWLGATPEVLGTYKDNSFETMALAGTLPDREDVEWGKKEIEEQQMVADYVEEKLLPYSLNIYKENTSTLHLGHIKHLITRFSAKLKSRELLLELIQELHPTPAVCGLPLDLSRDFILKEEKYNRDFYAGYIGIKTGAIEEYFVNLRCAKIYANGALLFVGGGITAQSNPKQEWEETELKSRFIAESL